MFTAMQGPNKQQWKGLIPTTTKEGVIYSDAHVDVTCQIQILSFMVRLMLSFKSKTGQAVENLVGRVAALPELKLSVSPANNQQIVIMAMVHQVSTGAYPSLFFECSVGGT